MAQVISKGIFSEEFGFPEKPPADLEATCQRCFAVIKTEETEKRFRVIITIKRNAKNPQLIMGWKIRCPECRNQVFFPFLCETTSRKILQLMYTKINL
ncbi:MAG: hypothetical protein US63_C0022G0014 [Candidatus Moranbacteria bacterium GW2011_GWC2_37_8]|nr:MAG: hypothetical protein US63_C0022G0014 [Candidatus Moranbacteria bacterium GW2011_GWC2_37_8]KKQ60427.1 MAG: hypothetical protein US82_C0035G0002 [Parcubacteria group bacterium GW2011_GWC1_38_22]KKQ79761.1 MAG: hypothetical protein UT03_C0042G0002 [Candidatus Moranbacteria bacterium GW2011_GWD2_38_7]